MSLTAFKKKSAIIHGSNRSGKGPGGTWLPQGPFGHATTRLQIAIDNPGPVGFSINGSHRNVGGVGRDMKMSKSGTPYRGLQPVGHGGTYGRYPSAILVGPYSGAVKLPGSDSPVVQPLLNSRRPNTMGTQYLYIKPSVLSTNGMLDKKYRWIKTGSFPNYWVQPNYTGNQTDTASESVYIKNLSSKSVNNLKVNSVGEYEGSDKKCGPILCKPGRSTAGFKYNDMVRNAPYTKTLYQPVNYDQYNLYITRKCQNPTGLQKPFPYRVRGATSYSANGSSITNFGSGCGTSENIFLEPPEWYKEINSSEKNDCETNKPQTSPFLN
jgi:hypothetical protein